MAKTHTSNVICVCWPTLYTWPDEWLAQTKPSKRKYKKTDQTKTKSWGFTATTEKTKAEIETDVANEPGYVPQRYVGTTTPPIYPCYLSITRLCADIMYWKSIWIQIPNYDPNLKFQAKGSPPYALHSFECRTQTQVFTMPTTIQSTTQFIVQGVL